MKDGTTATNKMLKTAIKCKRCKDDGVMPTKKDDLEALWMKIMERPTPQTSPVSSEGEESDDDEAEAFEADAGRSQAL